MFGLLKVLAFPVTAPLVGTQWLAGVLLDEAERQLYDVGAIREQMAAVEREFQTGQIDGDTFERRQEALFQRLLDAREYLRRKQAEAEGVLEQASPDRAAGGGRRKTSRRPARRRRPHG
jgi:hypothetical protein